MSELDGKTRKQTTELSKIPYCVEVLIEVGLIPGLFVWEKILLSQYTSFLKTIAPCAS